jgi:hypothetical protein
MAVTATPVFSQAINCTPVTIVNATAQTYQTAFTAGSNGSIITGMIVSSTDTSNRDITINITRSATNYQLTQVSIPLTAGTVNSVPAVSIFGTSGQAQLPGLEQDANGNAIIRLKSGDTLTINAPVTVTSGKTITAFVYGEDL